MEAGVRNQLNGKIVQIKEGDIMSEVIIQRGDTQITSVMTTDSLKKAGFKVGNEATALIKAINVVMVK
ncbi:MAG: TOBE domain-containing protein [Syntrophomonas sp.]|nr:TOBE domain-containing protein [Syntrophomonas sp.]